MIKNQEQVLLRSAIIPSVLIELGYISNANDEKLLKSPKWQAALATSLSKAVDNFMKTQ